MNYQQQKHRHFHTIFLIMILIFVVVAASSQRSAPQFDNTVMILQVDDQYRGFESDPNGYEIYEKANQFEDIEMSYRGQYVVGRTRVINSVGQLVHSNLYLWDIEDNQTNNSSPAKPLARLELDETTYRADFAISPAEQNLAFKTEDNLQLLTLPDLQKIQSVPIYGETWPNGQIAWSRDSRFVGTVVGQGDAFIVWNIENNQVHRHELGIAAGFPYSYLSISLDDGWVINTYPSSELGELGFIVCDRLVTLCDSYNFPNNYNNSIPIHKFVTQNGDKIIISLGRTAYLWERQSQEGYILRESLQLPHGIDADDLSPSGAYLASFENPDETSIWGFPALTYIQTVGEIPTWLPDETYFVTSQPDFILRLYELGNPEPIDMLDLSDVKGINPSELAFNELSGVFGMSEDGRKLLINMGGLAFVVGINY